MLAKDLIKRIRRLEITTRKVVSALLAGQYGAGNEPLYKLNANIYQIFISVWY